VSFYWRDKSLYIWGYDCKVFSDFWVPIALVIFFQVVSHIDCSLHLALFNFEFCSFFQLIMLAVFLGLTASSIPLEFYSLLAPHICDCFSSSSMSIVPLSILFNAGLVDMNFFNLSLSQKIFISSLRLKDRFAG
jgi:hypothetical protein